MKIGIEIECYINKSVNVEIAEYHKSEFKDYKLIKFEKDNSLTSKIGTPLEIITNILNSEDELNLMFSEIKQAFEITSEEDSSIIINKTCGCHIHFSENNDKNYIYLDKLYKIKRMHEEFLKHYDYNQYKAFTKQYDRDYAKEVFGIAGNDRYSEIIDTGDKGLEWRSFNLQGVRNFKDIRARLTNIFKLIQKFYNNDEVKYSNKLFDYNFKEIISVYNEQASEKAILAQQQDIEAAFNKILKNYEKNGNGLNVKSKSSKKSESYY